MRGHNICFTEEILKIIPKLSLLLLLIWSPGKAESHFSTFCNYRSPFISTVNGYTFRGSNSVIFISASHMNWGHLIKERICSHLSAMHPFYVGHLGNEIVKADGWCSVRHACSIHEG